MIKIVHVVNQFFAGLGGEEKAGLPVGVIEGSAGAARATFVAPILPLPICLTSSPRKTRTSMYPKGMDPSR